MPDAVANLPDREHPERPWWTHADQAEVDVLTRALVDGIAEHRPRCASCAAGYPPCPHIIEAIEAVVEWRTARDLLSYARWLRFEQERLDFRRDVAAYGRTG